MREREDRCPGELFFAFLWRHVTTHQLARGDGNPVWLVSWAFMPAVAVGRGLTVQWRLPPRVLGAPSPAAPLLCSLAGFLCASSQASHEQMPLI